MMTGTLKKVSTAFLIAIVAMNGVIAQVDDKRKRADALFEEGRALLAVERAVELRAALERLREARKLYLELGDKENEAYVLSNIGNAHRFLGELPSAIEAWKASLDLSSAVASVEDRTAMISIVTGNLGAVYQMIGEYGKAIEMFERARKIAIELKDDTLHAQVLSSSAMVYNDLGEHAKALELLGQSIKLINEEEDPNNAALIYNNIALVHFARIFTRPIVLTVELPKAAENLVKALNLLKRTCTPQACERILVSSVLNNLGKAFEMESKFDEAIAMYRESIKVAEVIGDESLKAKNLINVASIYVLKKDLPKAIEQFNVALPVLEQSGDRSTKALVLASSMIVWRDLGNPRIGIYYGKQAVSEYQKLRGATSTFDKSTRAKYLSNIEPVYRSLAGLLIAEGRISEAEQVLSMLKEEEILEFVRRDDRVAKDLLQTVSLSETERSAIQRYQQIASSLASIGKEFGEIEQERRVFDGDVFPKQARYDELKKMLADATAVFQKFLDDLKVQFGQQDKRVAQVDSSLQNTLRRLKANRTAVVSTILGEKRLNLIVTTADVQRAHTIDVTAAVVNKLVADLRSGLTDPKLDPRPAGQKLYDILVKPIEADLAGINADTLIWSLDGTLRYLPTAALWDKDKGYLAERFANGVVTLASRETLEHPVEGKADWRALGVGVSKEVEGFSPLTAVPDELDCIVSDTQTKSLSAKPICERGVLHGRKMIDDGFTFSSFENGLGRYSLVHIASHFNLRPGGEDESYLLLGGGEKKRFSLVDLRSTRLETVELMVLSACNTATPGGEKANGIEIEGFGAVAQKQGAKSVLATLWPVADESTRDLMVAFYKTYTAENVSKAEALRRAQLAMIQGKLKPSGTNSGCRGPKVFKPGDTPAAFKCDPNAPFTHPYFWAPFVLTGNWR